jgi:flagellar assembly protein FliH
LFRIDKATISYKRDEQPFVLAHTAVARNAPASLSEGAEAADNASGEPIVEAAKAEAAALLAQAEREADAIRNKAREEAATLTAQAKLEYEEQKRNGYQQGFEQGVSEGSAQGKSEGVAAYQAAIANGDALLKQALERVEQERASMLVQAEKECVDLSVQIARRVLGMAVQMEETAFPALVHNALEEIQHTGRVTVRVSPMEYEIFFAHNPSVLSNETRVVTVVSDPDLDTGDLLMQSDIEAINAGVRAQMQQIESAVGQLGGGS